MVAARIDEGEMHSLAEALEALGQDESTTAGLTTTLSWDETARLPVASCTAVGASTAQDDNSGKNPPRRDVRPEAASTLVAGAGAASRQPSSSSEASHSRFALSGSLAQRRTPRETSASSSTVSASLQSSR